MARHKEFDQNIALDKAMALFWDKGYAATSVQDLVDCMGIGRRSLYDTFTSKHDLFIAALDRYQNQAKGSIMRVDAPAVSPITAIRRIFAGFVAEAVADDDRKGCFVVNSAVELAGHDEAVTARCTAGYRDMQSVFHGLLDQAQAADELGPDHEISSLAQFLTNAVFGIRVMSKVNPDEQILDNIVDVTLSVLE